MNSRQYEKMMNDALTETLSEAGILREDCVSINLSADRTKYTIKLKDGSVKVISSGFDYFED